MNYYCFILHAALSEVCDDGHSLSSDVSHELASSEADKSPSCYVIGVVSISFVCVLNIGVEIGRSWKIMWTASFILNEGDLITFACMLLFINRTVCPIYMHFILNIHDSCKLTNYLIFLQNTLELLVQLEEMSVEINQQCEGSPDSTFHPRRGEACLAKFVKGSELSDFKLNSYSW